MSMTQDEFYEEQAAIHYGKATRLTHCYLCEPDANKRLAPKAGPLRGILRTSTTNPSDPTEAYHLSCGHVII